MLRSIIALGLKPSMADRLPVKARAAGQDADLVVIYQGRPDLMELYHGGTPCSEAIPCVIWDGSPTGMKHRMRAMAARPRACTRS